MFKKKTLISILLVIVILAFIKIFFLTNEAPKVPGQSATAKKGSSAMRVNGVVLSGINFDEKVFTVGTVLANEEVELRPEVSGKIVSLRIKEGTKVNKGELLVKINDTELQAQLSKLESNLKIWKEKADRQKKLFEMEGVSREEYDDVLNQLTSIEADIKFTQAQIAKTEIYAPFTGQIGLKNISEGSYVQQSFLIATIQQINPVKIDFSLPEKYSPKVKQGDEIYFTIEGSETIFNGKIMAIEPKIDAATRSLKVRALSYNPSATVLPGSFAKINLVLNRAKNSVMIPTQAVIPVLKGKKVLVCRNGLAISQLITTGTRNDTSVEVLSGLIPGDTVLTTGIMSLKDSMNVIVNVNRK